MASDTDLSSHDWLQIEQAASGCIDGTSDDWPDLRLAIEKLRGKPFGPRKTAAWLQGFCEGVLSLTEWAEDNAEDIAAGRYPSRPSRN